MELYQRFKEGEGKRVLASPFWWAHWFDGDGKRRRASTGETVKRRAVARAEEMRDEARQEAREAAKSLPGEISLADALQAYVDRLRAAKQASWKLVDHYRRKTTGLLVSSGGRFHLDGDAALHELEPVVMERLVLARQREGNKPSTICHEITAIRAATRYAAALRHRVPSMLTDRSITNPWRLPVVPVKTRYLSWDEWLKVYTYMDPMRDVPFQAKREDGSPGKVATTNWSVDSPQRAGMVDARDLLVALTLTGGRWGEVRTMTWDRVDCDNFSTVRLWGNKTQSERLVPVPLQVQEMLRRRYLVRESHLIFPGRDGKQRGEGSHRPIARALNACGLNRPDIVEKHGRATVHSLRHTFASWLLQNAADLSEVQDALGHKSLQMTRRYAHLSKGVTAARLGGILSQVAGGMEPSTAPQAE